MTKPSRLFCLLLVLAICLGVFAGCTLERTDNGDPTDTGEPTVSDGDSTTADKESADETNSGETTADQTENPKERNDLNDEYRFGDTTQEFVILTRATTSYEFETKSDALTGVEQAIFDRNAEVMQRCHVEFSIVPAAGTWDDRDSFLTTLRTNHALPHSQYDLVATHQSYLVSATLEGIGKDFNKLENIDVTKAWWSEVYYDECNYNGAIYMMYGDIAYTLYEYLQVVFFNEQTAEDLEIGDLYQLVIDGDWTFAKMQEYTKKVTTNMDAAEDDREYGLLTGQHANRGFGSSFYCDLAPKKADGTREFFYPKLDTAVSERMQAVVNFIATTPQVYSDHTMTTAADALNPVFAAGRSLFYAQMLGQAYYFTQNMPTDYGVLPYPKYDENQKQYRTEVCDEVTAILAPDNCRNADMTGTVTEMMSMISYFDVISVYYGEKLQYQYFNNPKCVESLNIIRESFAPSFTMVYSFPLSYPNSFLSGLIAASKDGIAQDVNASYGSNAGTWRKRLRDIFLDLDAITGAE